MRLKKGTIFVFIVFSFAVAIACILYCVDKQKKYQKLVEETPPAPSTIALINSLENERNLILNVPPEEVSADHLVRVATLNALHDSVLHSTEYLADKQYWDKISIPFNEQESKLNTQYLLGALGVLIGIAFGTWSSIMLYSRRQMELLARSNKQRGPVVKY
jgi:hypothetical protein